MTPEQKTFVAATVAEYGPDGYITQAILADYPGYYDELIPGEQALQAEIEQATAGA